MVQGKNETRQRWTKHQCRPNKVTGERAYRHRGLRSEILGEYQVTYENVCKYLKVHDLRRVGTSNGMAGGTEELQRGKLDVQQPPRYD